MKVQEFQAVILAGYGQRLYHLVDDMPKPLLPVANEPMILNVLRWLEDGGITSVFIVSTPESSQKMSNFISKVYESHTARGRIELLTPETYDTADALRFVADKIKSDFIVVPCDVFTDVPLISLVNAFRIESPTILSLYSNIPKFEYIGSSGNREIEPTLYVGLDAQNKRVILVDSKDFSDEDRYSYVNVHNPLLNNYGTINIYSNLQDSHIYLMKRWLLDFICSHKEVASLREDLIPLLVKCQHSKSLRLDLAIEKYLNSESDSAEEISQDLLSTAVRIMSFKEGLMPPSPMRDSSMGSQMEYSKNNNVVCLAKVLMGNDLLNANATYCVRVNTIPAYFEMNKFKARLTTKTVDSTTEISQQTQIGSESLVGGGTKIGERCSVKKSVIGSHCTIGKNVKIVNSVIFDYVVIEENVKLEGCIVSAGAQIKAKSMLKDCEIGSKYVVDCATNAKGEHFIESRVISADEDGY